MMPFWHEENWHIFIWPTSVRCVIKLPCCSLMEPSDQQMPQIPEDSEMYEAFGQMSKVWEMFQRSPEDASDPKRQRRVEPPKKPGADQAIKIMQAMGTLLLRLDAEQQLMKRQDSWICFMQTGSQAVLPSMLTQAQSWRKQQEVQRTQDQPQTQYMPLRCHLLHHVAHTLQERLTKLMTAEADSVMIKTAKKHGLLTAEGLFPFQKWNPHTKSLQTTSQTPIQPARMAKYLEQLQELAQDSNAVVKYQALKPSDTAKVVPWLLQISLRQDDLQHLLLALQGNTIWNLVGIQVKPHSLQHSKQALDLRDLMGKGRSKGKSKGQNQRP